MLYFIFSLYIVGMLTSFAFDAKGGKSDFSPWIRLASHVPILSAMALMLWSSVRLRLKQHSLFISALTAWLILVMLSVFVMVSSNTMTLGANTIFESYTIWAVAGIFAYKKTVTRKLSSDDIAMFLRVVALAYCVRSLLLVFSLGGFAGLAEGNAGSPERQAMIRQMGTQNGYAILWCLPILFITAKDSTSGLMILVLATFCVVISGKFGIYLTIILIMAGSVETVTRMLAVQRKRINRKVLATIAAVVLCAMAALAWNFDVIAARYTSKFGGGEPVNNRSEIWQVLWSRWWDADFITQIFGFGFDKSALLVASSEIDRRLVAHNDWLEALVDFGLIGLLVVLGVHWSVIKRLWFSYSAARATYFPLYSAYCCLLVASLLSCTVVMGEHTMILFLTIGHLMGLVDIHTKKDLLSNRPGSSSVRLYKD